MPLLSRAALEAFMHCIPGAPGLPARALLNLRRGLRAGCGMTGNQYVLPYTLGMPSWAQYLQTVGDAAVFGAQPSVPYFWQPCSTAGQCGFCGAPVAQQGPARRDGCPGAHPPEAWLPHRRLCLLPRFRQPSQHPPTWSVGPRELASACSPGRAKHGVAPASMIAPSEPFPPGNCPATSRLPVYRRPDRRPAAGTGAHHCAHVGAHIAAHVRAYVRAHILAHVGAVLVAHVKAHVGAHIGAHVGAHVGAHNLAGRRNAAHQARLMLRGCAGAPLALPTRHGGACQRLVADC